MPDDVATFRLLDGERILWSGKPAQGLRLSSREGLLIPFSLAWGGFAFFWEWQVTSTPRSPTLMRFWGVPFILAGAYLIFGRILVVALVRGGTRYAVTNRRILISRGRPFRTLIAIGLDRLPDASVSEGCAGRGTIRFGQPSPLFGRGSGFAVWTPSLDAVPQFLGIEDANAVFDLIQRTVGSARTT